MWAEDGGPKFEGSGWMFRLPDLYIKVRRSDDAISIIQKIKKTKGSYYSNKANSYITKIEERKGMFVLMGIILIHITSMI